MTFDQVLPSLVQVCETWPGFAQVTKSCVVRDLQGKVRLFLKVPPQGFAPDLIPGLQAALVQALDEYFVPPIRCSDRGGQEGAFVKQILDRCGPGAGKQPPWSARYRDQSTGEQRTVSGERWYKAEAQFSKQSWLDTVEQPQAPWPLTERGKAAIVTFYSFKGGAGRTTALCACAWQLARGSRDPQREPKKVVVIDLDLEAPGAGSLLGAQAGRGVLDFLMDFQVQERPAPADLDGIFDVAHEFGPEDGGRVTVLPAGALDEEYLEKLGRLDFLGSSPFRDAGQALRRSPVEEALVRLLQYVQTRFAPDYIFIDSRAGLHDLAGLSLHGLAHIDVLVSRASEQALQGLDLTLRMLGAKKGRGTTKPYVVVHSFAPADTKDEQTREEEQEFLTQVYQQFSKHIYEESAGIRKDADNAPHKPVVVRRDSRLEHIKRVSGIEEAFFSESYRALVRRISQLAGK